MGSEMCIRDSNHQAYGQDNNNGYRGRGQFKRCDEVLPGSSYRTEVNTAPSIDPPHAGIESRRNSRSVAPVEPVSAHSQPPFVASLGPGFAPPAPEVQPVVYASDPIPNQLTDEPSPRSRAATQKAMPEWTPVSSCRFPNYHSPPTITSQSWYNLLLL